MNLKTQARTSIVAITLCFGANTWLHAQSADLSHKVTIEIGDTYFLDGDSITIDSVTGPTDTIEPGHVYLIHGTYKLKSHPDALLSSNVTSGPDSKPQKLMEARERSSVNVKEGGGQFSVYLNMNVNGRPHISFYPSAGGDSFAGIYFGLGDTLMKSRHHNGATPVGTDRVGKP